VTNTKVPSAITAATIAIKSGDFSIFILIDGINYRNYIRAWKQRRDSCHKIRAGLNLTNNNITLIYLPHEVTDIIFLI